MIKIHFVEDPSPQLTTSVLFHWHFVKVIPWGKILAFSKDSLDAESEQGLHSLCCQGTSPWSPSALPGDMVSGSCIIVMRELLKFPQEYQHGN